jgi:hypothetical protein
VNFMHPSFAGRATSTPQRSSGSPEPPWRGPDSVDWRAARRAGRACCCPAKPAVIAVIPPRPGRNHPTDLLLCGHHYRVSGKGLVAAGATVLDLNGAPIVGDAWPPAAVRSLATGSPADRRR